jgi:hypothetical protein
MEGSGMATYVPMGIGVVAVALPEPPSKPFTPLKVQFDKTKELPSGPDSLTRYAQPSAYSQGSPVPSVFISPNERCC